jgi:peptidoglycan/LPS O-acetylase OafA/YrhL
MIEMKEIFVKLEVLRGLCAMVVVLNHARGAMFIGGNQYLQLNNYNIISILNIIILQPTRLGYEAVVFFFVISGYSIFHAVENKYIYTFYFRRFIRLYPTYLLGILVAFLTQSLIVHHQIGYVDVVGVLFFKGYQDLLLALIYMPPPFLLPQYWSLVYEVIYYILAPIINRIPVNLYFYISMFFYLVGGFYGFSLNHGSIILKYVLIFNFYFAVGIYSYSKRNGLILFSPLARYNQLIVFSIYFIILISLTYTNTFFSGFVTSLIAFDIIHNINNIKFKIPSILHLCIAYCGAVSYSLYIYHFALIYLYIFIGHFIFGFSSMLFENPYYWIFCVPFILLFNHFLYAFSERFVKSYLRG